MKLIGTTTSPYVRKVRIVLGEKRIDYVFQLEELNAPGSTLSEFNPLGKVPCLVMEDGKTLYDSRVIVEYLDTVTPVGKLLPPGGRARAEVKCWEALADGIMDAAILARLETTQRAISRQSKPLIAHQLGKVHSGLKALSQQLGDRSFCHDNSYSLADIAVGCALGWLSFRFEDINWREKYENLALFFDRLSARPSFQETVPV